MHWLFPDPGIYPVTEPGQVTVTLIRDGPTDTPVTIKYKTVDDAAKENIDYTPINEVPCN